MHIYTLKGKELRGAPPLLIGPQSGPEQQPETACLKPKWSAHGGRGWGGLTRPWDPGHLLWNGQCCRDVWKYSDKPYLASGLLDCRAEPLTLMKQRIEKQANIQGIHCIIKTTTGNRRFLGSWWIFVVSTKGISSPLLSGLYLVPLHLAISPSVTICATYSFCVFPPPVPQITPKHSEDITSATSTHNVHCLACTQAKDYSLVLWYVVMLTYWRFSAVISKPREDQKVWSHFIHSKYEPADISYCLKHSYIQYTDRRTQTELWESCCVFIAWTSVSMDSCIPFASAYLIP